MKVVLVTGANGYLGGRLCHALIKQGYFVRAFVLANTDLSSLPPITENGAIEIVYGDVTDYRSLLDACLGCHAIFHVAAVVDVWVPDPSRIFKMHHGKFFCTEYEKSKVIADNIALEAASKGVPIVLVCPGMLYALIEHFSGRLPGDGTEKFSFSYVDDVADGHISALKKGRSGEGYLLTGENGSFKDVFDIAASITGRKKPWFHIPLFLIEGVRVMRHQWAYTCEKAKRELGYNSRSLREGLEEVLPWLKSSKMINY